MKKQLIIALAISISAFSFAQKKELKAVEKAIKSNNFAEAKTTLAVVEPMLGSLDEKLLSKYNYLKGVAIYANGAGNNEDIDTAIEFLNKAEEEYEVEVGQIKNDMVNKILDKGNKAYEAKKFSAASEYFEKLYNLRKQDTVYLYYAAASAISAPDYDKAIVLYEELKNLNYSGIEEKLYAVDVKTNQKEEFPNEVLRKASVRSKTHINPTNEKTESRKGEIIKNVALIYISQGNNDKAINAIKDARAEDPDDLSLILSEANIYYKLGEKDKFKELLELATKKDPENVELQYNLGVISAESGNTNEAMGYYNKALELDPNYINAYINSAALVLGKEEPIINEMNNLGSSAADNKRYDLLREQRQNIYKEAVPFLTKALEINPKSVNAAKTLMNIYSVLGETDKFKAMKAKVAEIGG